MPTELTNRFGRGGYSKKQYTGSGLGTTNDFTAQKTVEIHQVRIHLDTAASTASLLNISLLDSEGSEYYTLLTGVDTIDLNTRTDSTYNPTSPIILLKDDIFRVSYANAGATKTYGITVVYKELK